MKKNVLKIGVIFFFSILSYHSFAEETLTQEPNVNQESDYFSPDAIFKDNRRINIQFNTLDTTKDQLNKVDLQAQVEDANHFLNGSLFFNNTDNPNENFKANSEFEGYPFVLHVGQTARQGTLPFPGNLIIDNPPSKEEVKEFFDAHGSRSVQPKNVRVDVQDWVIGQDGKLQKGVVVYEEEPQEFPNVQKVKVLFIIDKQHFSIQSGVQGTHLGEVLGESQGLLVWVLQQLKRQNPKTVGETAQIINQAFDEYAKSLKPDFNQLYKTEGGIQDNYENTLPNKPYNPYNNR